MEKAKSLSKVEGEGWVIKSLRISIEGRRGKLKVKGVKKGILVQLNSEGQTKGGGSTSKCLQLGITEKFYNTDNLNKF